MAEIHPGYGETGSQVQVPDVRDADPPGLVGLPAGAYLRQRAASQADVRQERGVLLAAHGALADVARSAGPGGNPAHLLAALALGGLRG